MNKCINMRLFFTPEFQLDSRNVLQEKRRCPFIFLQIRRRNLPDFLSKKDNLFLRNRYS